MRKLKDPDQAFNAKKLRWQYAVLTDGELTTSAQALGALLMHMFNLEMGCVAYASIATYARLTGMNEKTVRNSIRDLKIRGWIEVFEGRRGLKGTNSIAPVFRRVEPRDAVKNGTNPNGGAIGGANGDPNGTPSEPGDAVKNGPRCGKKRMGDAVKNGTQILYESLSNPLPAAANRVEEPKHEAQRVRARTLAECLAIAGLTELDLAQPRRALRDIQKLVALDVASGLMAGNASKTDRAIRIEACHYIKDQEAMREQVAV